MIYGFPLRTTLLPGDDLVLHVATSAPRFRVELYRCGPRLEPTGGWGWQEGCRRPHHLSFQDWSCDGVGLDGGRLEAWPGYALSLPTSTRPGVYLAVLVEDGARAGAEGDAPLLPHAPSGQVLFVVANPEPGRDASILYKLPLLTYHAYNRVLPDWYRPAKPEGSWSLYTVPDAGDVPVPVPPTVSLRRPGGGTGGWPSDTWNADPFDPTPRQTFVHWDWPFVRWLERTGWPVDYCTDLDVDDPGAPAVLARYRLLVSAGHDEYWTDRMRDHVEAFARAGGNVAFFGGNTAWWRVTFDDDHAFRRLGQWSDGTPALRPENAMTGVSFRNGGERSLDAGGPAVGYRVQHADHWVFEGTGLSDGEVFGDGPLEHLVGYECDGAAFDRRDLQAGRPVRPTGEDGTDASFTILGVGDLATTTWGYGNRAATMGVHIPGGMVFTAATTDWPRLLGTHRHPVVEQVTANVVRRLSSG